ncbi:MAG: hypothetical protein J4N87_06655, partial [Chloroflexi bacterium]|nr:hypothetical protein [Chloroflexota bacterium]
MTRSRFSFRFIVASVLVVVLLAAAACFGGDGGGDDNPSIEGLPPEFQRLSDVWELLNREQIDGGDLDPLVISDGA